MGRLAVAVELSELLRLTTRFSDVVLRSRASGRAIFIQPRSKRLQGAALAVCFHQTIRPNCAAGGRAYRKREELQMKMGMGIALLSLCAAAGSAQAIVVDLTT